MGRARAGLTGRHVEMVATYPPRACGIATFTYDLCEAIAAADSGVRVGVSALNGDDNGDAYSPRVGFQIRFDRREDYVAAAVRLNDGDTDVVCLQHEYGLYGGDWGSHILAFLQQAKVPVVTVLHTVIADPPDDHRAVAQEIAHLSDGLVVLCQRARSFLVERYGVEPAKIHVIPHGVHPLPADVSDEARRDLGLGQQTVLMTFGLINHRKGLDLVIRALPDVVAHGVDVVYLIVGKTNERELEFEGESYRRFLRETARTLGVDERVVFVDRFVTQEELHQIMNSTDIYVTPYLFKDQVSSGTLSYAVGAGKVAIATPYFYAEELLGDGCGLLVPFDDPAALAAQIVRVLTDHDLRRSLERAALARGQQMRWPRVAAQYMDLFDRYRRRP